MITSLAKLGLKKLRVWDHDKIEEHNIPNQAFLPEHIGKSKALALKEMLPFCDIDARDTMYTGQVKLGDVVFMLIDTMDGRKKIFNENLKMSNTRLMIETRAGSDMGTVLQIDPRSPSDIKFWESRWFPDDKAEVSACGSTISVGPTGDILSGYAVWAFMNWLQNGETIDNKEQIFCTHGDTRWMVN